MPYSHRPYQHQSEPTSGWCGPMTCRGVPRINRSGVAELPARRASERIGKTMAEEDNDQLQTPLKPVDLLQVAHDLYVSCEQWQKAEGIFEMEEPRARELIRQRLEDDAAFRQAFFDWFRDRAIMELAVEMRHQRKVEREHEAQRLGLSHPYPSAYVRHLPDMNARARAPRPGQ